MSAYNDACAALALLIQDYRQGELPAPDAAHVARWAEQFSEGVRLPILQEMMHVLGKSYFSKDKVLAFLKGVVTSKNLCGDDPKAFWQSTKILQMQTQGNSQRELLQLFAEELLGQTGLSLNDCGTAPQRFLYLDDGLFSGGRITSDLTQWVTDSAPATAKVYVVVIAAHAQGKYFTEKNIEKAAKAAGKNISLKILYKFEINNRIFDDAKTDVLRPVSPGSDAAVKAYVSGLGKEQSWRKQQQQGALQFFSDEPARAMLEQEFLRAGVGIRLQCPYLNEYQRPLGNTTMRTTGFGTLFVTWRNCPNNAPLVLWAGDPWYPLFRRITN